MMTVREREIFPASRMITMDLGIMTIRRSLVRIASIACIGLACIGISAFAERMISLIGVAALPSHGNLHKEGAESNHQREQVNEAHSATLHNAPG